MRVLVTGSSGLVGSALTAEFRARGYEVVRCLRKRTSDPHACYWNPEAGILDPSALEGCDAVVHLAGASIGRSRWTRAHRERIRGSRVKGTRLLAETLARLRRPPSVFLSASATGYYGDRGDQVLTEQSEAGIGFRSAVCQEWEAATEPAECAGIRVVHLRSGIVLSRQGGLLPYLLIPARLGLVLRLGSGGQYWSWISKADEVDAIVHLITWSNLRGPVNLTAPNPVTQAEFADALATLTGRRRVVTIAKTVLEKLLGRDRAGEVLLSSTRALPRRLLERGYSFQRPKLDDALCWAAIHEPRLTRGFMR